MKKELRLRDGETLEAWCTRLGNDYGTRAWSTVELREVLREVSIKSYTVGSNAAIEIMRR